MRETIGSGSTTKILDFVYDNNGLPFALCYSANNGQTFTDYFYVTNLQGDVVRLVNSAGSTVANYTYDAWGKLLSSSGTMASINPLRYRGYYYDTETGWYYLQNRYYDPEVGRFINADILLCSNGNLLGYNTFAYCEDNPVNHCDPTGTFIISTGAAIAIGIGVAITAVFGAIGGYNEQLNGGNFWAGFAYSGGIALATYVLCYFVPEEFALQVMAYARLGSSALTDIIGMITTRQKWTWDTVLPILWNIVSDSTISTVFYGNVLETELGKNIKNLIFAATDTIKEIFDLYCQNERKTQCPKITRYYENARGYPVSCNPSSYSIRPIVGTHHENDRGFPHSF